MEKIIIVDDEPGILDLCERVFRNRYSVSTTTSGENALKIMTDSVFDLLITDLKMPGIGGIELLKRVKSIQPETEVMVFTGQGSIESAVETFKSGAYDYILKPFDITDLESSVDKCLEYASLKRRENILKETIYLYQLSQEISSSRSEKDLLNFVIQRALKALKADSGTIFVLHPDTDILQPLARAGESKAETEDLKIGDKIAGWVAQKREAIIIQDGFKNTPQFSTLPKRKDIVSSMISPLLYNDTLLGTICLNRYVTKTNYIFSDHDLEMLQLFCVHASLILMAIRNTQALKELTDMKTNFVANVSHELKTPMMAIGGAAELLASMINDEKVNKFLDLIERNTVRMKTLVNDLLDFSKMESGKFKLTSDFFNIKALIYEALQDFEFRAKEKKINLYALDVLDISVEADMEKLKQVLSNLIGNALKFTPENGEIKVRCALKDDSHFVISVADTGIGINKNEYEKIFGKFYQIDGSPSREHAGFGLGLSIVKSIVESHHGDVWVESEPGKGSEFFVVLPVKQNDVK